MQDIIDCIDSRLERLNEEIRTLEVTNAVLRGSNLPRERSHGVSAARRRPRRQPNSHSDSSRQRRLVLDSMPQNGDFITALAIAKATDLSEREVRLALSELHRKGVVKNSRGRGSRRIKRAHAA